MIRLKETNINTAAEYERIAYQRSLKGVDFFDKRRWRKLLSKYKGGELLDIGCLDSQIGAMALKKDPNAEVFAVDQVDLSDFQDRNPEVFCCQMDVYKLDFAKEVFDYVVMGEVIEHLDDPKRAIAEAMRVLKPHGILALSTPLNEALEPGAVDAERHLWSFDEMDMHDILGEYGTVDIKVLGSTWFPYRYCWPQMIAFCKKDE